MILASHLSALNGWYKKLDMEKNLPWDHLIRTMERNLGLMFDPNSQEVGNVCMINNSEVRNEYKESFKVVDLLDYIYAVLHSAAYSNRYVERGNIDYSEVPCPKDPMVFWRLVDIGNLLRPLHLLESPIFEECPGRYPFNGEKIPTQKPIISKVYFEPYNPPFYASLEGCQQQEEARCGPTSPKNMRMPAGKIWINKTQYFDYVPEMAWGFYMGGYQPAQKWLKDRNGHSLEFWEIEHYQKIIVALTETHRLMQEINTIIE